ncbi:MAG TPA: VOC family protein [Nitrospiria bacterium]|nr:VOC family protein [Nitrospiria bacterium]
MKVSEIAFVVYPVTDLESAREFYEGVLGLTQTRFFGDEDQGMIEYDIGPGTLAIGWGVSQFLPSPGGGCAALEVDEFEEMVNRLRENDCTFITEPIETPVCFMVVISDPAGNSLMIHQRKTL